jgi:Heavy metal associated domain 2
VARLRVLHDIPGRLRVALPDRVDPASALESLRELNGVTLTRWSPRTRSLVVLYDPATTTPHALRETIEANVEEPEPIGAADAASQSQSIPTERPAVRLAAAIRQTTSELDAGIASATGGWLDLKLLLPLALLGWAARELIRGQVAPLAWSSALWYAHGLFRDYNVPGDNTPGDEG